MSQKIDCVLWIVFKYELLDDRLNVDAIRRENNYFALIYPTAIDVDRMSFLISSANPSSRWGLDELFRSWKETVKVFFLHTTSSKGGLLFYADAGKTEAVTVIYLCSFSGTRNVASSLCFTWAREDATPLCPNFLGREKVSKRPESRKRSPRTPRKRALFRFTSDLVAQLCLKRRLASLSEVENRRKKWLTFDSRSRWGRFAYFVSGLKRDSIGFLVGPRSSLRYAKFWPKPDDARNTGIP